MSGRLEAVVLAAQSAPRLPMSMPLPRQALSPAPLALAKLCSEQEQMLPPPGSAMRWRSGQSHWAANRLACMSMKATQPRPRAGDYPPPGQRWVSLPYCLDVRNDHLCSNPNETTVVARLRAGMGQVHAGAVQGAGPGSSGSHPRSQGGWVQGGRRVGGCRVGG